MMSGHGAPPPPPLPRHSRLHKHNSWSPDLLRDEAWERRKGKGKEMLSGRRAGGASLERSKSVTNEDLEELRGCLELGFGFDSPEVDPKLSDLFPALGLYQAVNKQYHRSLSRSSSVSSLLSLNSDNDSDQGSMSSIYDPGDDPKTVKTRLKQWAQVVACSVKHSSH
ncbi:uncharacterized protein LOC116196339 [Punica granatum]|uniref:Membrane insertase YidC n=2 Tax=Punica granatum TaxID=22663 RepID=A0A218X4B2_PUNGR|nr:uncharacterized protein LOC116196339 [Punica granatum]OWM79202.1 hypothetical protein CDL15_Pgr003373 [Punica granatum]PKI33515.1 hypothetical protein CRG98_046071 [Punica granatum]